MVSRSFWVSIATTALILSVAGAAQARDLGPLEKYKDDAKSKIEMNEGGKKYQSFIFDHDAHLTESYLLEGTCSSCHHTQKDGSAAPKPCGTCHDVGGEADETKLKAKGYHSKKSTWEGAADKGGISCVGCHKSHNKAVKAGTKTGNKSPSKCVGCHPKK